MKEQMKTCRFPSTWSPTFDEKSNVLLMRNRFYWMKNRLFAALKKSIVHQQLGFSRKKIDVSSINRFLCMKNSMLSSKKSMFNQNVNMFIKKLNLSWKNRLFRENLIFRENIDFLMKKSIFVSRNLCFFIKNRCFL